MKSKQEIITGLKNGKTINEVCHENKLTLKQLMELTRTKTIPKLPKYISRSGKRYRIIRRITANESEYLVKFDWDLDYLPLILRRIGVKQNGN